MDANFFRFAIDELRERILGFRLGKIFCPVSGVASFDFGRAGYLIYVHAPRLKTFYLSPEKPPNPSIPAGLAMYLRKRFSGQRVLGLEHDWPSRRFSLCMSGPGSGQHIIFDFHEGIKAGPEPVEDCSSQVQWPAIDDWDQPDIWKSFPQLSPPLRQYFKFLPIQQRADFCRRVVCADFDSFYVSGHSPANISLWPPDFKNGSEDFRAYSSALEAALVCGAPQVFDLLGSRLVRTEKKEKDFARKKLKKALANLERDKKACLDRIARISEGILIQANLFQISGDVKVSSIELPDPDNPGELIAIKLDERITVQQNMERIFRLAAKARRGLVHIERRHRELLERQQNSPFEAASGLPVRTARGKKQTPPPKYKGIAVARYRCPNGFWIVRGKNQKANHKLLSSLASPFDYWFHAADGPGAHVILKRDHPGQEVPRSSILMAASLAGLYSHFKMADKARVYVAFVRGVRKIKGAALGQVSLDTVEETVLVDLDADLENKILVK